MHPFTEKLNNLVIPGGFLVPNDYFAREAQRLREERLKAHKQEMRKKLKLVVSDTRDSD